MHTAPFCGDGTGLVCDRVEEEGGGGGIGQGQGSGGYQRGQDRS
jgi:hypothetical protein